MTTDGRMTNGWDAEKIAREVEEYCELHSLEQNVQYIAGKLREARNQGLETASGLCDCHDSIEAILSLKDQP